MIIEGCTTCSQVSHSDCSVTAEPPNQLLLIIFTPSKLRKLIDKIPHDNDDNDDDDYKNENNP